MSLRRRLSRLEEKPIPRRETPEQFHQRMEKKIQRQLALPLPEDATKEEHARGLELLVDAQSRIRADRSDTGGLDAVREYALSLHAKYGTEPYWGQPN
jgi:hypothetical protein